MLTRVFRSVSVAVVCLAALWGLIGTAHGDQNWTAPQKILEANDQAGFVDLVPDQMGRVHMFWSQADDDGVERVHYSAWDGQSWLAQTDLFSSPIGNRAYLATAVIDQLGMVHLTYVTGNEGRSRLYYSRAWIGDIGRASAWSTPVALIESASMFGSALALDSNNHLHAMFGGGNDGKGVYDITSTDLGNTWQAPLKVFANPDEFHFANLFNVTIDDLGRIHLAWAEGSVRNFSDGVYYARFDPDVDRWTVPMALGLRAADEYTTAYVGLAVQGDFVAAVWQGGVGAYRQMRFSLDGGNTWTTQEQILPDLVGENGLVGAMGVDASGQVHLVTHGRYANGGDRTDQHGLFYTRWTGAGWLPEAPIVLGSLTQDKFDPNNPRLAVRAGHELLVVYGNDPARGLWFMTLDTGAPEIDSVPYPTPMASATPVPTATVAFAPPTLAPRSTYDPAPKFADPATSSTLPLLLAMVPVLLLIGLIAAGRLRR